MRRIVFLAHRAFTDYDIATGNSYLCEVAVTEQCATALRSNGYALTQEEAREAARQLGCVGLDRSHIYGGSEGFNYKELQKLTDWKIMKSYDIRAAR